MAFTDRYLKIPIDLFNKKQYQESRAKAEATGVEPDPVSYIQGHALINPFEISYWRDSSSSSDKKGNPIIDGCLVVMKNGDSFVLSNITRSEFGHMLNQHQDKNQNP